MFGDLAGLLHFRLQLVPALLLAAIFTAQIVWQTTRVFKAPHFLIRINAAAILGTTM